QRGGHALGVGVRALRSRALLLGRQRGERIAARGGAARPVVQPLQPHPPPPGRVRAGHARMPAPGGGGRRAARGAAAAGGARPPGPGPGAGMTTLAVWPAGSAAEARAAAAAGAEFLLWAAAGEAALTEAGV